MRRASIFFCLLGRTLAALINHAAYEDTTLEYYDNYDDSVTHAGAIARCWQRGGWLVMPKYSSLNGAVSTVSRNNRVWIGLGDFGVEGAYEFIDGTRLTWVNWNSGQPDNHFMYDDKNIDEDSGEMRNGQWNDLRCYEHQGYVCQIPNSQRKQFAYSHFSVYQGLSKLSYDAAANICRAENARLVRISNEYSIELLSNKLSGLGDVSFWVSKYPMGVSSCYAASSDGLNVENCGETRPFVCETVEPHDVKVSEENLEVDESSDMQIRCTAFGLPTPDVTWFRNDVEVINQVKKQGHSTIKVHEVRPYHAGLYICRANNVIGGKEYGMEAYSTVTVLPNSDDSVEHNKKHEEYVEYNGPTEDTMTNFGSMSDSLIQRDPYDDRKSQPKAIEQDPRRQ